MRICRRNAWTLLVIPQVISRSDFVIEQVVYATCSFNCLKSKLNSLKRVNGYNAYVRICGYNLQITTNCVYDSSGWPLWLVIDINQYWSGWLHDRNADDIIWKHFSLHSVGIHRPAGLDLGGCFSREIRLFCMSTATATDEKLCNVLKNMIENI